MSRFSSRLFGTTPVSQWLSGGGVGVQSLQYGTVAVSGTSNTATITAVDITRSVVVHLGSSYTVSASELTMASTRIALTNATTVTATKGATGDGGTATVSFVVIQFNPGVLRRVQRGTVSMGGSASATATISAVDTQRSMVNHLGTSLVANDDRYRVRLTLTDATTITGTTVAAGNSVASFEVWEFA